MGSPADPLAPCPTDRPAHPNALRARWQSWRDHLLADATFRERALAFAPTRWIARRRARALFDIVAGFVYAQVLQACVQLGAFDLLRHGPRGATELARLWGLPPEGALRLLDAAVALQLLERRGAAGYGLGPLGAAMVDNAAVAQMVAHHRYLYADLGDPVALLRGRPGTLAGFWPYATDDAPRDIPPERVAQYSALMSASLPLVADEVLSLAPLHGRRCLLDVGGGEGRFLSSAARHAPHLALMLFDLPAVAERGREALAAQGFADRVTVFGGDFLRDALPRGADVISLVRVVHDQDDAGMRTLLAAAFDALPPGGEILLAEPMADTPGARGMGDAYFGFYLLAMGRGQPRSAARLAQALADAGFEAIRQRPTRLPLQTGLLTARRPG